MRTLTGRGLRRGFGLRLKLESDFRSDGLHEHCGQIGHYRVAVASQRAASMSLGKGDAPASSCWIKAQLL